MYLRKFDKDLDPIVHWMNIPIKLHRVIPPGAEAGCEKLEKLDARGRVIVIYEAALVTDE